MVVETLPFHARTLLLNHDLHMSLGVSNFTLIDYLCIAKVQNVSKPWLLINFDFSVAQFFWNLKAVKFIVICILKLTPELVTFLSRAIKNVSGNMIFDLNLMSSFKFFYLKFSNDKRKKRKSHFALSCSREIENQNRIYIWSCRQNAKLLHNKTKCLWCFLLFLFHFSMIVIKIGGLDKLFPLNLLFRFIVIAGKFSLEVVSLIEFLGRYPDANCDLCIKMCVDLNLTDWELVDVAWIEVIWVKFRWIQVIWSDLTSPTSF